MNKLFASRKKDKAYNKTGISLDFLFKLFLLQGKKEKSENGDFSKLTTPTSIFKKTKKSK